MSTLFLTIDTDTIAQAITDIAAKLSDLSQGTATATLHFESLIGSEGHPEISLDDKISRLASVHDELSRIAEALEGDLEPDQLSEEAIVVLSSYEAATARPKLDVEHIAYGAGVPSAHLAWLATLVRGKLAKILVAISEETSPPEETFYGYFQAFEEEVGSEEFDDMDDLALITTTLAYADALVEEPKLAWEEGIEVPVIMKHFILDPYLALAAQNVKMH